MAHETSDAAKLEIQRLDEQRKATAERAAEQKERAERIKVDPKERT